MDDFILEENLPDTPDALDLLPPELPTPEKKEPRPGHSTGPTSIDGKARSSMNRLTHGCRSAKTLLPDEDPAEFEAAMQCWYEQFQPAEDDDIAVMLVEETGHAHWMFKRNRKRLEEVDYRMPCDGGLWTSDQDKRYSNALRYRTTAQREFFRWFKALEQHYNRIHRDQHLQQLALAKMAAVELKVIAESEKNAVEKQKIKQVVEVEVIDGQCRTSYYRPNEEVLQEASQLSKPPLYVARFFMFPDDIVPPEYEWTQACRPYQQTSDGMRGVIQKVSWKRWLELIEYEKSFGAGHALPSWSLPDRQ